MFFLLVFLCLLTKMTTTVDSTKPQKESLVLYKTLEDIEKNSLVLKERWDPEYDARSVERISSCGLFTTKYDKLRKMQDGQDRTKIVKDYLGEKTAFFAVFDGHGSQGAMVSEFLMDYMHHVLLEHPEIRTNPPKALYESFVKMNMLWLETEFKESDETLRKELEESGSTASVSLVINNKIYTAWTGDSEVKLFKKPFAHQRNDFVNVINLTPLLHNFEDPDEVKRVTDAGSFVYGNRLDGELIISRAIGDSRYNTKNKNQNSFTSLPMISNPYVSEYTMTEEDKKEITYLVVASDGFWDYVNDVDTTSMMFKTSDRNHYLNSQIRYYNLIYNEDLATALVSLSIKNGVDSPVVGDDVSVICITLGTVYDEPETKSYLVCKDPSYGLQNMIKQGVDDLVDRNRFQDYYFYETMDDSALDLSIKQEDVINYLKERLQPESWLGTLHWDQSISGIRSMSDPENKHILLYAKQNKFYHILEAIFNEIANSAKALQHKRPAKKMRLVTELK